MSMMITRTDLPVAMVRDTMTDTMTETLPVDREATMITTARKALSVVFAMQMTTTDVERNRDALTAGHRIAK